MKAKSVIQIIFWLSLTLWVVKLGGGKGAGGGGGGWYMEENRMGWVGGLVVGGMAGCAIVEVDR